MYSKWTVPFQNYDFMFYKNQMLVYQCNTTFKVVIFLYFKPKQNRCTFQEGNKMPQSTTTT